MDVWNSKRLNSYIPPIVGIVLIACTRIIFRSHLLYDIDSVNFALGISRFDPASHQPHPPGYFLYICMGRLVNRIFEDPNTAFVAISIIASCGAAWMIYLLTKAWINQEAANIAVGLFLFSPLCWFHGIVALTYIVEAFFSGLIGYLCWRVYSGRTAYAIPAAIAFGVAAGFRPSTALMLGPLFVISLWGVRGSYRWAALLAAAATIVLWFIPMVSAAGGIWTYLGSVGHLWSTVPGRRTTFASPWLAIARIITIGWIFVLCFGFASLFLFRRDPQCPSAFTGRRPFLALWIIPGFLFFSFVFLNYVNSGYLLVLSPPAFTIVAARLSGFIRSYENRGRVHLAIAAGIAGNCIVFGFAPLYCTHRSVREFERNVTAIARDLRTIPNPAKTLIIGFDSHFLGYRHAGYYLPEFVTVQYPEVGYRDGRRVFIMHNGDTVLTKDFVADSFERFVLFPLPESPEYAAYLDGVLSKLPEGTLQTVSIGHRQMLTGQGASIDLLFPTTARRGTDQARGDVQH